MYYKPKTTRPQVYALPFLIHGEIFHFKPYLNGYNLTQVSQNQFLTGLRHFLKKFCVFMPLKKLVMGKPEQLTEIYSLTLKQTYGTFKFQS